MFGEICTLASNATMVIAPNATLNPTLEDETSSSSEIVRFVLGVIVVLSTVAGAAFALCLVRNNKQKRSIRKKSKSLRDMTMVITRQLQEKADKILTIGKSGNNQNAMLLNQYKIPFEHIAAEELIGRGMHGEVWMGRANGVRVAIKKMFIKSSAAEAAIQSFREECLSMAKLQIDGVSHPNLVQMLYCCWTSSLMLLMEYHPLGSLRDAVDNAGAIMLSESVLSKLMIDVCEGDELHTLEGHSSP